MPRARPPMRRGLKPDPRYCYVLAFDAARAAPYEKGTETLQLSALPLPLAIAARAAPYEKGTETQLCARRWSMCSSRARGPL